MCAAGRRYLALQGYASTVVSLTCGQGALVVGLGSVMMDQLQQQRPGAFGAIPASSEQLTWSVSLYFAGVMMGSLAASWLGQRYGARNITMASSLIVVVFWTFLALSVNIGMVLVGRFALGFYFGVASPSSGGFVSGVTSSRYRGLATFSLEINAVIFAIFSFLLSKLLAWWQVALLVGVPLGLLTLLALLPLPSDPVWLVSQGRLEEASGSLAFYRGPGTDLWLLRVRPEEGANGCWWCLRQLQRRQYWLPTVLCAVQLLMFVWCGGSTVRYYTVVMVRQLQLPLDPLLASALIIVCHLPLACLSACLVDVCGRRALLLFSSTGMFVCHGTLALLQLLPPSSPVGPPLSLAALMAGTAMFALGNSPLTWTLLAELLPSDVRQMYASLLVAFWGGMSLLQVQSFPQMLRLAGFGGMFSLWAAVALLHVVFVLRFLPETSRLTSSELDQLFKKPDSGALIVNTISCTDESRAEKRDPLEHPPLYLPI